MKPLTTLTEAQRRDLEAHLSQALKLPCDNTLSQTKRWLKANRIPDPEAVIAELQSRGGHCDCEVMLNVLYSFPEEP